MRAGDVIIHVNAVGMLPQVYVADPVVQVAPRLRPILKKRSIRDVVHHTQNTLDGGDVKVLHQLQAAFGLLSHMPRR